MNHTYALSPPPVITSLALLKAPGKQITSYR